MAGVRHNRRTRAKLLAHFADTGRIDLACSAVGVSRDTHYEWLKKDPDYKAEFDVARDRAVDLLEAEAWRRGKDGVPEPVIHAGRRVVETIEVAELGEDGKPTGRTVKVDRDLFIVRYSDQLLMFLLKGRKREVYGDRVETTGKDGSPLFPMDALRDFMSAEPDDLE
jgi:hypothetical protein